MGYLGLVQASRTLTKTQANINVNASAMPYSVELSRRGAKACSEVDKTIRQLSDCNIHVSFCGHAMHYACYEECMAKMMPKSNLSKDMYMSTEKKFFYCPLCKKLNNILIPYTSGTTAGSDKPLSELDRLARIDRESLFAWIRAPQYVRNVSSTAEKSVKRIRVDESDAAPAVSETAEDEDIAQLVDSIDFQLAMSYDSTYGGLVNTAKEWSSRYPGNALSDAVVLHNLLFNSFLLHFGIKVFIVSRSSIRSNDWRALSGQTIYISDLLTSVRAGLIKKIVNGDEGKGPVGSVKLKKKNFPPFRELMPHLEIALSAIAYTICCNVGEVTTPDDVAAADDSRKEEATSADTTSAPYYHTNKEPFLLHKFIDALSWTIVYNNCQIIVSNGLSNLICASPPTILDNREDGDDGEKGEEVSVGEVDTLDPSSAKKRSSSAKGNEDGFGDAPSSWNDRAHWLSSFLYEGNPLPLSILSVPLLDYLVLAVAAVQVGGRDAIPLEAGPSNGLAAMACCYPWVCIARLAQIMLAQFPALVNASQAIEERIDMDTDIFGSVGTLAPLMRGIYHLLIGSTAAASFDKSTGEEGKDKFTSEDNLNPADVVLEEWLAFLKVVEYFFFQVPFCNALAIPAKRSGSGLGLGLQSILEERIHALPHLELLLTTDQSVILEVVSLWLKSFIGACPLSMPVVEADNAVTNVDRKFHWTAHLYEQYGFLLVNGTPTTGSKKYTGLPCYAAYPFPRLSGPTFVNLPKEYTKLHATICSLSEYKYDFPAMCLVCGAILDAGGKQQCCLHAQDCSGEAGIFFLLQDCSVLLCHGLRCAYFPTPYVDIHGESRQNFRGKPLYLDLDILGALRRLWLSHGIPREVFYRRSSSNRMIILGYY